MLRGDPNETFFTNDFNDEKPSVLFCASKQPMPNVFTGTVFNVYGNEMLNKRDNFYKIFFYLPSITDRKEKINQYKDQVSIYPVDCHYENFADFAPDNHTFDPSHLHQNHSSCSEARATMYNFFKSSIEVSNSNLIQNVYSLIKSKNLNHSDLKWVGMPKNNLKVESSS